MNFDTETATPDPTPPENEGTRTVQGQLAYLIFVLATILLFCAPAVVLAFWRWAL